MTIAISFEFLFSALKATTFVTLIPLLTSVTVVGKVSLLLPLLIRWNSHPSPNAGSKAEEGTKQEAITRLGIHEVAVSDPDTMRYLLGLNVKTVDSHGNTPSSVMLRSDVFVHGCTIPAGTLVTFKMP